MSHRATAADVPSVIDTGISQHNTYLTAGLPQNECKRIGGLVHRFYLVASFPPGITVSRKAY